MRHGIGSDAKGQRQHAIKAGQPGNSKRSDNHESREEPMALLDMSLDEPAPQAKPAIGRALPLEVPDQIELVPIDPPSQ